MIIWSGFGFLVAVITFAACFAMNFLIDAQFGKGYYSSHPWAIGVALIIGGVLSSIAGFAMRSREGSRHTFFFIPMHWAGLVVAGIGILVMFKGLLG